ncbi:MAG: hypothetical protein R3B97_03130 [Dehalococcoidia bacterium]|nr:hypothetical protein [Dehalococcoidia bacterium]MCB9485067.1 hypothetical protein [Thermoflexaceae bacterium]
MPPRNGALKAREFLFLCEDQALPLVPSTLRPSGRSVMWTILQLHYGDPKIHYELQPMPSRNQVELGLHFEATIDRNDAWASLIAHHAAPLQAELGSSWELEIWTASWRRLHRVYHAEALTTTLAAEVAGDLARLISATADIVRDGLAEASLHAPATSQRAVSRPPAASLRTWRT